ncbi:MAG: DNA-3-methyladenine glycosylase [Vampirovibrionales bacterium]|nr:DNA-3-methyladenine glycosylase [Vampirovibrionales bacterium]
MPHALLSPQWLLQDTVTLAQQLLGKTLAVKEDSGDFSTYTLIETEAYTADDPACHAYGTTAQTVGTKRSASLYKSPGTAYVYLIYGMHHCLNVVTEAEHTAGAVLFRGIRSDEDGSVILGPGRLCKTLGVTKATHNHLDLCSPHSPIQLWEAQSVPKEKILATPRIGISQATERLWRFIDTRYIQK